MRVRWWFLTFPLYSHARLVIDDQHKKREENEKESASDSVYATRVRVRQRTTNINLSMIYCVFNTSFEHFHSVFALLGIRLRLLCFTFAKESTKHHTAVTAVK